MKKILLPYAIVPALVLCAITALRAWLEVQSPDSTATKLASVSVLSLLWMVCIPAVMLKKGLSLVQMLTAGLIFFVVHRLAVGAVYAMAWAGQWTVSGTGEPVRYVVQARTDFGEPSTMSLFLNVAFVPVLFGLVILALVWLITWSIGFRGKRPLAAAAPSV